MVLVPFLHICTRLLYVSEGVDGASGFFFSFKSDSSTTRELLAPVLFKGGFILAAKVVSALAGVLKRQVD